MFFGSFFLALKLVVIDDYLSHELIQFSIFNYRWFTSDEKAGSEDGHVVANMSVYEQAAAITAATKRSRQSPLSTTSPRFQPVVCPQPLGTEQCQRRRVADP